jgi:uncharacterized membrane protein YkoI
MKKIVIVALIVVLAGAYYYHQKNSGHFVKRPVITDTKDHNAKMDTCMKVALEKHPGAILEVEVDSEDDQLIADVDIQGNDGKIWEVECSLATGQVTEDQLDHNK